ncbi:hypothetical protein A9K55_001565 [Cordyceps militaris]|uniref:Uncharacterized protein n=1 Tax=Cordyceps militaris TaxID=73501 RepID=A0A2H4SQK3_CORMI|nr:hypothetical protein A9K55_001565 [Cordyceps militaris]
MTAFARTAVALVLAKTSLLFPEMSASVMVQYARINNDESVEKTSSNNKCPAM